MSTTKKKFSKTKSNSVTFDLPPFGTVEFTLKQGLGGLGGLILEKN
jgi:hypothetical protein